MTGVLNQVLEAQATEQIGAEPYERNERRGGCRGETIVIAFAQAQHKTRPDHQCHLFRGEGQAGKRHAHGRLHQFPQHLGVGPLVGLKKRVFRIPCHGVSLNIQHVV